MEAREKRVEEEREEEVEAEKVTKQEEVTKQEPDFYKTTVELDRNKVDNFREVMPGMSLKWFVDACLDAFLAKHKPRTIDETISETVDVATERLKEGGLG